MAWQDLFPLPGARIDAEEERELRLVGQARGGADWALSALVARYQPTVSRYLSRLTGSVEQSRVLAERIFQRMDQRIRGPQGGKQLRLWLLRTSTEMGLDALREPHSHMARALTGPSGPAGLLPGKAVTGPLRLRLSGLGEMTTKTSRQVRKLIWSAADETAYEAGGSRASRNGSAAHHDVEPNDDPFPDLDPREALRFKMIRAVLAELPYGDAQCLALHLVAGLNQAEVARALGITGSAARRRVVHGLQLFAMRYEAAAASLRLPPETAQERTARVFEEPALAEEFAEPVARLSNGAIRRGGAAIPPPAPLSAEPPRVVPANPQELFEDESAEQLDRTIAAYDLADEATVVIDPIVVEADSTLPVPVADIAREPGSPTEELWFARDVFVIPEPLVAVGSVPLGDSALILEVVDEPLDEPRLDPVAPVFATAEPVEELSDRSDDNLTPSHTVEDMVGADVAPDESDELVLVDLEAMIETPIAHAVNDAAEETYPSEPVADGQADDTSGAAVSAVDELNPDDLVSIAEVRAPEVAGLSSSAGVNDAPARVSDTGVERDEIVIGDVVDTTQLAGAAAAPGLDGEPPAPPRVPRRVPVLTTAHEASQDVARLPRRVPVLTTDAAQENVSEHAESIARQAHVERVSHR